VVGLRPFLAAIPGGLPRSSEITVDLTVLLLAAGFSLLTALLTGLIPALRSSRTAFHEAAALGTERVSGGRRMNRTQAVLVVTQVALAFTLLATTGLLARSYLRLNRVDLGFDTDNLVVARISLPDTYRDSEESLMTFFSRAETAVAAIPGVEGVCVSSQFPYIGGTYSPPAAIETEDGMRRDIALPRLSVSPEFFEVMDLSILRGRKLSIDDVHGGTLVAVVNETFARRAWPDSTDPLGTRALGARIQVPDVPKPVWITVVGIAEDFRFWHGGPAWPLYFMPSTQDVLPFQTIVVRTAVEPSTLVDPIRSAIWDIDRDLLVEPSVFTERLRSSPALIGVRFGAIALGLLATIAGLLALMGIYGLLAFTISRQTREIGIRIAIGARLNQIVRGVVERGMILSGIGLVTGCLLTFAIGQLLRNALFEVRPTDAISLGLAGAIIILATLMASLLPARKVVRIDPVETLRRE
jgi:predicted permease